MINRFFLIKLNFDVNNNLRFIFILKIKYLFKLSNLEAFLQAFCKYYAWNILNKVHFGINNS